MRHRLRVVAALPQRLRQRREGRGRTLGQCLPGLLRAQAFRIGERPLELVADCSVGEIVDGELKGFANAVGPVGADAEPPHVGDDQKRGVLQGEGVLPELVEGAVEVGEPALVLPGEAMPFPHVGPAVATGLLSGALLEAVDLAGRVGLGWRRLSQGSAQVDEVLLRGGAFLQLRRPPLGDEFTRGHGFICNSGFVRNEVTIHKSSPLSNPRARIFPASKLFPKARLRQAVGPRQIPDCRGRVGSVLQKKAAGQ